MDVVEDSMIQHRLRVVLVIACTEKSMLRSIFGAAKSGFHGATPASKTSRWACDIF
jgi:hypothetical protein